MKPHLYSLPLVQTLANQFMDDTILITKAHPKNLKIIKHVLDMYAQMSGLHINLNKTIFVPIAISEQLISSISRILGYRRGTFLIKYLGLQLSIKKPRKQDFLLLISSTQKRLAGWKSHLLSISDRRILVCFVMSVIPLHYMHAFRLPTWLTKHLDRLARAFLRKGSERCTGGHCLVN